MEVRAGLLMLQMQKPCVLMEEGKEQQDPIEFPCSCEPKFDLALVIPPNEAAGGGSPR